MSWPFIQRILYEYRMLFLWIGIAIAGFLFFTVMFRQTQPTVAPVSTPDTNVYY